MDTIFIRNLNVQTIVGIHPWERTTPQTVLISLELETDVTSATASDNIADALDYDALAVRIRDFVTLAKFQLIETLAERIAALVLESAAVAQVVVELHKPGAIATADTVGVRIQRKKRS